MRRNKSFPESLMSSKNHSTKSDKRFSSFERATVSCCYSVDSFDEDDYYVPASPNEQILDSSSEPIDAELGLTEDHFSRPEGYFGFTTAEELEMAIESCKEMILETPERTEKWKQLVIKLAQLRKKYVEVKEGYEDLPKGNVISGHQFELGSIEKLQQCELCCGMICGVVHKWYFCVYCGYQCHSKCANLVTRVCAHTKAAEKPEYILEICPEQGLSQQNYRCGECKRKFMFKDNDRLPRLCDYNGKSYCMNCHWNSLAVIPARVVHNWDFTPRKVCQASLQFLKIMRHKPLLNIESLNPALFGFVPELRTVKKLRLDILLMKRYFMSCRVAQDEKMLLLLKERQHFVESADTYSLRDLTDVISGVLLEFLEGIHSAFLKHITETCQGCKGKGFICEFCKSEEVLYPFYRQTIPCPDCNSLFHQTCYQRRDGDCPKCTRRAKQKQKQRE